MQHYGGASAEIKPGSCPAAHHHDIRGMALGSVLWRIQGAVVRGSRIRSSGGSRTLVRRPWTVSLSRSGIAACSRRGSLLHCCKAQARRGRPSVRNEGSRCRYGTLCRCPGACCGGQWSAPRLFGAIPHFPGSRQALVLRLPLQWLSERLFMPGGASCLRQQKSHTRP